MKTGFKRGLTQKSNFLFFKACGSKVYHFKCILIFLIAIKKIKIQIKNLSTLPERPIKIFLKVFKPFESKVSF
jgi:hypothetical protein